MTIAEEAEGIVLDQQELAAAVHFAHLTAAFYRSLVEKRIGRAIALHLTEHWMDEQACCPDEPSD